MESKRLSPAEVGYLQQAGWQIVIPDCDAALDTVTRRSLPADAALALQGVRDRIAEEQRAAAGAQAPLAEALVYALARVAVHLRPVAGEDGETLARATVQHYRRARAADFKV